MKKQLEIVFFKDIPAELALILAAHRVRLVERAKAMSKVPAAHHRRGDSFGGQCRCELSLNILIKSPGNTSQKVEFIIEQSRPIMVHLQQRLAE